MFNGGQNSCVVCGRPAYVYDEKLGGNACLDHASIEAYETALGDLHEKWGSHYTPLRLVVLDNPRSAIVVRAVAGETDLVESN